MTGFPLFSLYHFCLWNKEQQMSYSELQHRTVAAASAAFTVATLLKLCYIKNVYWGSKVDTF